MHKFQIIRQPRAALATRFGLTLFAVAALGAAAAACSSSNSDNTTPSAAASTSATASSTSTATSTPKPTDTPTPAATPTPSAAELKADTARYFVYTARPGDTFNSIAQVFNGEPGSAKAGYPLQIQDVNNVGNTPSSGDQLAIPLLATPNHIIPSAGLALAFQSAPAPQPVVLEPGPALMSTYGGKVALHRVALAPNNAGYRMEYWLTDSPTLTASNAINFDAKVSEPLMSVACGSMVAPASNTTVVFTRNGASCSATALVGATLTPQQIADDLVVPAAP